MSLATATSAPRPRFHRSNLDKLPFFSWMYFVPGVDVVCLAASVVVDLVSLVQLDSKDKPEAVLLAQEVFDQIEQALLAGKVQGIDLAEIFRSALNSEKTGLQRLLQIAGPGKGYTSLKPHEVFVRRIETESGELAEAYFVKADDFLPKGANLVFLGTSGEPSGLLAGDIAQLFADNPGKTCVTFDRGDKSFDYIAMNLANFEFSPKVVSAEFVKAHQQGQNLAQEDWRDQVRLSPNFTGNDSVGLCSVEMNAAKEPDEVSVAPSTAVFCEFSAIAPFGSSFTSSSKK